MFLEKEDKSRLRGFHMKAFIFLRKQVIEGTQKTMSGQM